MVAVASMVFVGTPATSLWPLEGLPADGGRLFRPTTSGSGSGPAECGGLSPTTNSCARSLAEDACKETVCSPVVRGTLGYTGTITATVLGQGPPGSGSGERYASYRCSYLASSATKVGPASLGGCDYRSNAPYECNLDPRTGQRECGNYLWPPFRLVGSAAPPATGGPAPVGSWSVSVES